MKIFKIFYSILFLLPAIIASGQKAIDLEDIWERGTFAVKGLPGFSFSAGGDHYTQLAEAVIEEFDLRTGKKIGVVADFTDQPMLKSREISAYSFSADEKYILLSVDAEPIYRWSQKADFFVYNRTAKSLIPINTGGKARSAEFSPNGQFVAYVFDNNLYYKDISNGAVMAVTTDGEKNKVINGVADWVYEEEFELVRAFAWSPDNRYLAFFRFDESQVPQMTLDTYHGGPYPDSIQYKYPKVGENNAVVTVWVYDLQAKHLKPVHFSGGGDHYLPRLAWTPDNQLCITWMNRLQNHVKLFLFRPGNGVSAEVLLEEKNPFYLELYEPDFLSDGSGFIWRSEKSGYSHLYRYNMLGQEQNAVTEGSWDVTDYYGVDKKDGRIYFQAASQNPMQREIYSVQLNGKKQRRLSHEPAYHSAQFNPTFTYWIDSYSGINTPPAYILCAENGQLVRILEQNKDLLEKQKIYGVQSAQFFKFRNDEDIELNGFKIQPAGADKTQAKYPVLMFVYGGPGSQQVLDQWKVTYYWWFQMLVQQGFVVVCVDNRGTGGRGEGFKKTTYRQLGNLETLDQIAAARHIGKWPFVDSTQIGIFGWSYGGYLSSLCLLKGSDVFKAGIAVAPVTNWKWYDSIYTERYMGLYADNEEGYEKNAPINFAQRLSGSYLLVHGLADDNVHFQHSAEMANRLIFENKQFETLFYPNRHHGIADGKARLHLFTKMTNFLKENLTVRP